MKQNANFLIVGLGLMGGSYAMGLTQNGHTVNALDKDPATIQWALEHGLIAGGTHTLNSAEAHALIGKADYIVLALYPNSIVPWLTQNKPYCKPGAVLTDLAGVKACFVPQAQALLAPHFEFIPSHPMAGREVSGVQNANPAIFKGANFIITPTAQNTPAGIAFATTLAQTLGFGNIIQLSPAEHDQMIGYVSQLTHAIAVSLMNANSDERLPQVTGDSFRDLTRIANMNEELWSELFIANAPALTSEIDDFIDTLQDLRQKLANGNKEALKELFRQSTARRRLFDK
ncbi:prephenate dehydrogenase [Ruminococcaceae bacterium OttesenSCG-928-A16]|nr:prephenate dehydrogenase [Ruminococcaceae bacterium OttesenSCG-928-A16]